MRRNQYQHAKLEEIVNHNDNFKTFRFENIPFKSQPGQFAMVWIPGMDEKPISLSGKKQITVKKVGPFTERLFEKQKGDYLDIRGPYGNGFPSNKKNVVLIGGGCGLAPLMYSFSDYMQRSHIVSDTKISFVFAAKTESELLFLDDVQKELERRYGSDYPLFGINVTTFTEDGSHGDKGFVDSIELPKGEDYFICGPEVMMYNVAEDLISLGTDPSHIHLSMERYMKCAMGICGNCSFDGYRVCADGPVLTYDKVMKSPHFNKMHRTRTGELTEK